MDIQKLKDFYHSAVEACRDSFVYQPDVPDRMNEACDKFLRGKKDEDLQKQSICIAFAKAEGAEEIWARNLFMYSYLTLSDQEKGLDSDYSNLLPMPVFKPAC